MANCSPTMAVDQSASIRKEPFYRTECRTCKKYHTGRCPVQRALDQKQFEAKREEWAKRQSLFEAKRDELAKRQSFFEPKRNEAKMQSQHRSSEKSPAVSEASWSSFGSVSTTATLALSPLEEREARKIEKKLREISHLQEKQSAGVRLAKNQLEKVNTSNALYANLVMVKIRAGAFRPEI